mgnify:CR=1 FL=1
MATEDLDSDSNLKQEKILCVREAPGTGKKVVKNRTARRKPKSVWPNYTKLHSMKTANGQIVDPRLFVIIGIRLGKDTESGNLFPEPIQPNCVPPKARV